MSNRITSIIDLLRYARSSKDFGFYVGWLGYSNLGDELLLKAAEEMLPKINMATIFERNVLFAARYMAWKRHSIAILGGGTQIGEVSPIERFRFGISRSKTGVVLGAGVSPVADNEIPSWLEAWGDVLRALPYVGVRGPDSAAVLSKVGVKADVLGDPVCWYAQNCDYWTPVDRVFGVNVGHSYGHMYGSEIALQSTLAEFVRLEILQGWSVEFFCVWPEDLNVTLKVANDAGVKNPKIWRIYQSPCDYLSAARCMAFFVGVKLHAVALAMCANVPSVMLEYRPKCREFMSTVGQERFVVRTDEVTVSILLEMANKLVIEGEDVSKSIQFAMQSIRQKLVVVGAKVSELARCQE